MSKTALKVLAVAATVVAAVAISFATVTETIRSLEKELNETLGKECPDFKGWVSVDQLETGSLKVRIQIFNPDCSVRATELTEHSRYMGWYAARSWLSRRIHDLKSEAA